MLIPVGFLTWVFVGDPEGRRWETQLSIPGVKRPAIVSAEEAPLADDELVIGVTVGDHHRAYRMTAFWPPKDMSLSGPNDPKLQRLQGHIVNDMINDTPVTITHCVRTQCTRVLTDPLLDAPLPIRLGGFKDREMLLLIGEERFAHSTPTLPYADQQYSVVEWRQWRKWYPNTDVYVEPPPAG